MIISNDNPRTIIHVDDDKLKSYSAAKAEIMPGVEHRQHKGLNNRAENSHQPTRVREHVMRRFKSAGHVQRFLSAFGIISSHFRVRRQLLTAERYRAEMKSRFETWGEVSCVEMAA
jgi:putative transposase